MKKLLALLLLFSSPAMAEFRHFNEWSNKEKAWFLGYQTVSWIDYSQSKWALTHPCDCYYEQNFIYGKQPHPDKLIIGNILAAASAYAFIGANPKDEKLWFLQGAAVYRTVVVIHNDRVGIDWRVAF